jgi:hypothetical protein
LWHLLSVAELQGGASMRIDFTGRQMEITPDLREYAEERLQKFSRLLHDLSQPCGFDGAETPPRR